MHTPFSDGTKLHAEIACDAIKADLDFIIVTDHNIKVNGVEGYYSEESGRVLLLTGEEIHDMRRKPQSNHFLVFGVKEELSHFSSDPQTLIDETRAAGGYGFLAHPFDPAMPSFNLSSLGWQNWEIENYAGLEIWNYMSNFKGHLDSRLKAIALALNPDKYIAGPRSETLSKWDQLLSDGRKVAAVGGSDAHALIYRMGPIARIIFPYEYLFRAVNTHILVIEELNGDLDHDRQLVFDAIGRGNSWIGYDLIADTAGFRFTGQSKSRGIMGDEIKMIDGATLQVKAPSKCKITLLRYGEVVAESKNDKHLTYIPTVTGAYRVECKLNYNRKERGWIYSNPIYLV